MAGSSRRRPLSWLERALVAIGIACLGYYGYRTAEAWHFQREQTAAFEAMLDVQPRDRTQASSVPSAAAPARDAMPAGAPSTDGARPDAARAVLPDEPARRSSPAWARASHGGRTPIALLEVPRLDIEAPVMEGDDTATLGLAVGHLPDTPMPWEAGNSAVAAHRDGLFRPLKNIRVGDEVRVRTLEGDFLYRVRDTRIVMPDDLSVLAPGERDLLTLITCYPFHFVGHAPKRFIVHAERVTQ